MTKIAAAILAPCLVVLAGGAPAMAAVKPGLEGAQDLFRRNRWEEARAHLRAQWGSLPAERSGRGQLSDRALLRA